jgi:hypothetical protein
MRSLGLLVRFSRVSPIRQILKPGSRPHADPDRQR